MKAFIFALAMMAQPVFAVKGHICFPQTEMLVPMKAKSGITKAQYDAALDLVQNAYAAEVQSLGFTLSFNRAWSDSTINSDTDVEGTQWVINSYGGLARYKGMTPDGYTLVACHELGHHLGGAPRFSDADSAWASVEGEADYWATLQCAKKVFNGDMARVQAASLVLGKVLADLGGEPVPSVSTPDSSVVTATYEDHPASQCRLDTYTAGGICVKGFDQMSATDPSVNACFDYNPNPGPGSRSLCWFKP